MHLNKRFWRREVKLVDTQFNSELSVNDDLSLQNEIDEALECHQSVSAFGSLHVLGHKKFLVATERFFLTG